MLICLAALSASAAEPPAPGKLPLWHKEKVPWIDGAQHFFVAPEGKPGNPGTKEAPWDIETGFNADVPPGSVVWLRGGTYGKGGGTLFTCRLRGTEEKPVIIRGLPGERAIVDGAIDTGSAWSWFWGFEVTNSYATRRAPPADRNKGLDMRGRGQRAINMLIHDTGHPSLGFWTPLGDGAEAHGCLLWHCGRYTMGDGDYGGGPVGSFYGHNTDGTRYITDNIAFRNFTMGLYMGSSGNAKVDGVLMEGNVCFQNHGNIMIQADKQPMQRDRIIGNFLYHKRTTKTKGGLQLGWSGAAQENLDVVVKDNYLVADIGDDRQVHVRKWKDVVFTGNTVISPTCLATLERRADGLGKVEWDNNRYFGGDATPFKNDGAKQTFDQWRQATGFDKNSTRTPEYPDEIRVFVRANKYEPGRGHIVIYNWPKAGSVPADISSVLPVGAEYEIRDAQNYFGKPVLAGVYDGKPVNIPMNLTEIMMPVGDCPHLKDFLAHTAPEFGVFVVLPALSSVGRPALSPVERPAVSVPSASPR